MRGTRVILCLLIPMILCGSCQRRKIIGKTNTLPQLKGGEIELKVATFNIRNENNQDQGERSWPQRIRNAVRLIRQIHPDVMGMQEVTHGQAADLRASLPDYDFMGLAREDGKRQGEYAPIFYKKNRFIPDPAEEGTYWLSDTPEHPGSTTWGNTLPRIVTWSRMVDLTTGRGFYVINTHYDHRDQGSREHASQLISRRIDERKYVKEPVILLGDFNAVEANPAVSYLKGQRVNLTGSPIFWNQGLLDTYRIIHPADKPPKSLHLWGSKTAGWKVDHILVSKSAKIMESEVVMDARPFASDHYPVMARILFPWP